MKESAPIRILLVDDDEIDVMSFERSLKKTGINYELKSFVYSDEAISYVNLYSNKIDCVFLDYMLPKLTGLELMKKIKPELPGVPISIITSHGDERLAVEIMKAGAFDYFTKNDVNPEKFKKVFHSIFQFIEVNKRSIIVEKELEEQRDFISKVTKINPAVIYVYDKNSNKFIFINHPWKQVLGFNNLYGYKNEISSILDYVSDEGDESNNYLENHFKNKKSSSQYVGEEIEFNLKNSLGKSVWFKSSEKAFKVENDIVVQVIGVAVDITRQKQYEKEISLERAKALKAANAKSEFLSNMSHEIRTPMNAILGLSDILLGADEFEGRNLENLKSIKYSAENLLIIINDILDLSKIESGKLSFEKMNFSMYAKMENFKKVMNFKASEKEIELKVIVDKSTPEYLKGDPYRLNQILINVAGNAIKFTRKGNVTVSVKSFFNDGKITWLQFDIIDTGIGIPKKALSKIFESYTQAYTDTTRLFGGTGLGLTITKKLVEFQNGEISVESEIGKGTKFTIKLPFELGEVVKEESLEEIKANEEDIDGMKVLIVEDNVINQLVIKQVLKGWKCNYDIADNGEEAVDLFRDNEYDIILMDLQMPKMNGFEATNEIRKLEKDNEHIYIVALTADAFPDTKKRVLKSGFSDFITKPFKPKDLLNVLGIVMRSKSTKTD